MMAAAVYPRPAAVQNLSLADIAVRRTQSVSKSSARMGGNHDASEHDAHP